MYEIIENFLIMCADFINKIFIFQVEFEKGQIVPIGIIAVAFIYIVVTIYLICDSFGLLESGEGD